jgi:hypothetical protein
MVFGHMELLLVNGSEKTVEKTVECEERKNEIGGRLGILA